MMISYERSGGMQPPPDNELLEVDETGAFHLWRSIGWATVPPTPVGRFAGQLAAKTLTQLWAEARAAMRAGNLSLITAPGSPIETVTLGEVSAEVTAAGQAPEPWNALLQHLRQLLQALTDSPQAAIALEVSPDGKQARLVHQGREPLRLDLSELAVRATQRDPKTGKTLGEWRATPYSGELTVAEVGWSMELPFRHGFKSVKGSQVRAVVSLTIFDGDTATPASIASP